MSSAEPDKQCWTLRTQLRTSRSVARQRGDLSNNYLIRHLVGTLTSH